MVLKIKSKILVGFFCFFSLFVSVNFCASALKMSNSACDVKATECLFSAISENDVNGVRVALSEGADVNAKDSFGKTALNFAVDRAHANVEIVRTLLGRCEIDVNAADFFGDTALHSAILNDNEDVVHALLMVPGLNMNIRGWKERTPLELALIKGKEKIAQILLSRGDTKVLNDFGCCEVLEIARERGYEDIVKTIITRRWIEINIPR